jgi:hypothetical protein
MCAPGCPSPKLSLDEVTRGFRGAQHGDRAGSAVRDAYQSLVHSHVLPHMSYRPWPFGAKLPTGEVPSYPSSFRFCQGNAPCHVFAAG